jgi:predicted phosphate transport protein (TIGR00153 family)
VKTTNPLARLLRQSPFESIQEHNRLVARCTAELPGLFDALKEGDRSRLEATAARINELESEADTIKNNLRYHMPRTLMLPVDRRDILTLIQTQDGMADTVEDIAKLLTLRDMKIPEAMWPELQELIKRVSETCDQANNVVETLDELLEVGFRGRYSKKARKLVTRLKEVESQTDDLSAQTARKLFSLEKELDPVSVIFWNDLIQHIAEVANRAENVGDVIMLFLAR